MTDRLVQAPRPASTSFLDREVVLDLDGLAADIAFLGIPFGDPYRPEEITNDQTNGPTAVRRVADRILRAIDRYDFDIGGTLFDGRPIRLVDCGDVPADTADPKAHYRRAESAVRKLLAAGAMPLICGGDHGIPIPVLRALDGLGGPVTLVQIDAHIDWRDHVNGVREGYSSPIRRASEMDHVGEIFQIGIRSAGSARPEEVDAARAYGAHLITAYELHDAGARAILDRIPDGGRYYLTIDADGLDPAVMPAVNGPAPGGVTFHEARHLVHGLVGKGRLVGMDVVELAPAKDVNAISAITAGRLFVNAIGAAVRADYFEGRG